MRDPHRHRGVPVAVGSYIPITACPTLFTLRMTSLVDPVLSMYPCRPGPASAQLRFLMGKQLRSRHYGLHVRPAAVHICKGRDRDEGHSPDMAQQPDIDGSPPAGTGMPGALDIATIAPPDPDSVTQLLGEVENGQPEAWNRIYALLYRDLHQIARSQIRQQRRDHVRSPTSLISETWLKLASADFSVENRAHLVALVARAMRFVLLDEVRRALAEKRGEGMDLLPLDETQAGPEPATGATADPASGSERSCQARRTARPGGGDALFRRSQRAGDRRRAQGDRAHRAARPGQARAFLFSHLGDGESPSPCEPPGDRPAVGRTSGILPACRKLLVWTTDLASKKPAPDRVAHPAAAVAVIRKRGLRG